ncbi:MAG: HAD family hydrolase [Pirellulales bacterium]
MPPHRLPRAVVFDMDGLMFNTEALHTDVGSELLQRRGYIFDAELKNAMMGRPGRVALKVMIDRHGLLETAEELMAESELIFEEILASRLEMMPGLTELLAALESAGLPKAVATSSGIGFVRNVMSRFQLEPRFQFILTAEDVVEGKPHPEIYLKAAARLGLDPADVLVLEDSHNGCTAAAAAGMFTVAVPGEPSRHHDFSRASLVIDTLRDPRLYQALGL